MSKSFKITLNPADKTFTELATGNYPWWENIKKNKSISIQVRKENTISVYYNGGLILKDLQYNVAEKAFASSIHQKYIPLKDEDKEEDEDKEDDDKKDKDAINYYQPLSLKANGVKFTGQIIPMPLSQFEDAKIKAITKRVKKYHNSKLEKAIQYKFAAFDQYIIDTEFQVENTGSRIDLVRLDKSVQKIVLIEVKRMGDSRLLAGSGDGKVNIYDQLKKYHDFAVDYHDSIRDYYIKVLQIKNDLGLTGLDVMKLNITNWQVECKPLLVFGDCKQDWIDQNASSIDMKIKNVAYGAYYYGGSKYSLDLVEKSKSKNRHFF
jgi:hypothetical protein